MLCSMVTVPVQTGAEGAGSETTILPIAPSRTHCQANQLEALGRESRDWAGASAIEEPQLAGRIS